MNTAPVVLSVVIPCKNEAPSIPSLLARLSPVLDQAVDNWEIILVDDGSTDGTGDAWQQQMVTDRRLRLVTLVTNVGKEGALFAGLAHTTGQAVIPMDADLQDPPALIEAMIAKWRAGHDNVYGIRTNRDDPLWKRLTSAAFYAIIASSSRTPIPRNVGDFRLLDRSVVDRLLALPETDRFTRGLYMLVSRNPLGIPYDRPPRTTGERSYRLSQSIDQAISFLAFTDAPLQAVAMTGLVVAAGGFLYLGAILGCWVFKVPMALGWPSLIAIIITLGGMQLLAMGIIGLYLSRMFREVKRRPPYLVAKTAGFPEKSS